MKVLRFFGLLLMLAFLLGGCTALKKEAEIPPHAQAVQQAQLLEAQKDYRGAAQAYLALAQIVPAPERYTYLMRAIELLVLSGDIGQASTLLNQLEPLDLTSELRLRVSLAKARIALVQGRAEETLRLLQQPPRDAATDLQAQFHELRAQAYMNLDNPLESVKERLLLEYFLREDVALQENRRAIWQALSLLPEQTLKQLAATARPAGMLAGWLELAHIAKSLQGHPTELDMRLSQWRKQYPGHPAEGMIEALLAQVPATAEYPAELALLLPLTGQYAGPAAAVRDGFLAAYYAQPNDRPKPAVRIYDTAGDSTKAWTAYQDAVRQGARLVVGPLDKEGLQSLMQAGQLEVPVLALNTIDSDAPPVPNLYQFGLLPEDETYQVAERAWMDGHHRALVFVPTGPWGERLANGFRNYWKKLGGTLLEVQTYNPQESDFSDSIRALLDIDKGEARYRELRNLLKRKIGFEPRRRQDADFLFLAAFPQQARQIQPQLRFHHATDLPVYATSHIYSGIPGNAADQDVEGVMFCDIPWLLSDNGGQASYQQLKKLWPDSVQRYPRLYALGIDAYNVAPNLTRLRDNPYSRFAGATGALALDPANHLHRELVWARFVQGQPRLLEPSLQKPISLSVGSSN